ncbi:MAG: hypothetical protein AAFX99_25990 [Myxococcota bacterium]
MSIVFASALQSTVDCNGGAAREPFEIPSTFRSVEHPPPEDAYAYAYTGSYFRQTSVTDIKALLGYSTLDYISKYENTYNGLFFDGYLDAGISLLSFDEIELQGVQGADPESSAFTCLSSFLSRCRFPLGHVPEGDLHPCSAESG